MYVLRKTISVPITGLFPKTLDGHNMDLLQNFIAFIAIFSYLVIMWGSYVSFICEVLEVEYNLHHSKSFEF